MGILVAAAGVGAVLLPLIFAYFALGIWAAARRPRLRRVASLGVVFVAAIVGVRVFFVQSLITKADETFAEACASQTQPKVNAVVNNVDEVLARFLEYYEIGPSAGPVTVAANIAFPHYLSSTFLLSGARPYSRLTTLTRMGTFTYSVGNDGGDSRTFSKGEPATRYGFEMHGADSLAGGLITRTELWVRDYANDKTLAVQPVFVLQRPAINVIPSLLRTTPVTSGVAGFRSCPEPYVLSTFVKTVLQPRLIP